MAVHNGNHMIDRETIDFLTDRYARIGYDFPSMRHFMSEIIDVLKRNIDIGEDSMFLDIGCGRGYFLRYLYELGYKHVQGIDPSVALMENKLFDGIRKGSFEDNTFDDNSIDIVFTCHTLHHLPSTHPLHAIREMLRISRKYIVIVEINNTNIPMFFRSILCLKVELNAFRYNLQKVRFMLSNVECKIIYSSNMRSGYLSGSSFLYKQLAKIGMPPYNISIAEKK